MELHCQHQLSMEDSQNTFDVNWRGGEKEADCTQSEADDCASPTRSQSNPKCVSPQTIKTTKWVKLNVGGKIFATTVGTLVGREPESMLARMFSQEDSMLPSNTDDQGAYMIDRSPHYFEPIINYLRHGQLIVDDNINLQGVLEEAKFFSVMSLVSLLEAQILQKTQSLDHVALNRPDVVKALIRTSHLTEIRFQGVNLAGADLRKLDLRNINFKV